MIYIKTERGAQAIKDRRAVELSHGQRTALILFEGKRSLKSVLETTSALGVTAHDIDVLVSMRLLAPAPVEVRPRAAGHSEFPASTLPGLPHDTLGPLISVPTDPSERAERYRHAYPLATQLTASLGLRGFKLNLAVEAAQGFDGLVDLVPKLRHAVGEARLQPLLRALDGH